MLHGYDLPRSVEIVPGVYVGGEAAALSLVAPRGSGEGGPEPDEFKFFSGKSGVLILSGLPRVSLWKHVHVHSLATTDT